MSNVPLIEIDAAPAEARRQLEEIKAAAGSVPAMYRAAANSPAALASVRAAAGALAEGTLDARVAELLAVAVANRNGCGYCLAAHTALGGKAGLTKEQLVAAQDGTADDPKTAALLAFALAVVDRRGRVDAADFEAVRAAGWDDEAIVETIAHVAVNTFTNLLNIALDVPLDFPAVPIRPAK